MIKKSEPKAYIYFLLGAVCLLGFLAEYVMLKAEMLLYGKNYYKFTITESITHWVLVCVVWGMISLVMFYIAVRVYGFDISKKNNKPDAKGIITGILLISGAIGVKFHVYEGWKCVIDFKNSGGYQFIFQYIYYLFEIFLLAVSLALLQEGCEKVFKKLEAPFGGILIALTWGLSHIISQDSLYIGLTYFALSLLFGAAYIAFKKNLYITFLFMAIMFLV